jgi:hypothetical protein
MNVAEGRKFDGVFKGKPSNFNGKRKRNRNRKSRNSDRGKGTAKPSLTKLSFATSVDATRTPLTSASPQHLAIICSNPMAATHLEGKGLKPTSTFIQMAPMELVVRETFLLDLAPP